MNDDSPEASDASPAGRPDSDRPKNVRPNRAWAVFTVAALAVAGIAGVLAIILSLNGGDDGTVAPQSLSNPLSVESVSTLCLQDAPRTVVLYEPVKPERDVSLSAAELAKAHGVTLGGAWVSRARPGDVAVAGAFSVGKRGASRIVLRQWHHRQPLAGAGLRKGFSYTVFVRISLASAGALDGVDVRYRDGTTPGTARVFGHVEARTTC